MPDDDDNIQTSAHVFSARRDAARYGAMSDEICSLLASHGMKTTEMIAFLSFYVAHIMLHHLGCNPEMFRGNLLQLGNCTIRMFGWMAENTLEGGPDDASQLKH